MFSSPLLHFLDKNSLMRTDSQPLAQKLGAEAVRTIATVFAGCSHYGQSPDHHSISR